MGSDTQKNDWNKCLSSLGLTTAVLLSTSSYGGRRVYAMNGLVSKVVLSLTESGCCRRSLSIREEYALLVELSDITGIPSAKGLIFRPEMSVLVLEDVGRCSMKDKRLTLWRRILVLIHVFRIICVLSLRGISHNDIKQEHIFVKNGRAFLIDFDQASRQSVLSSFARNFFGREFQGMTRDLSARDCWGSYLYVWREEFAKLFRHAS